MRQPADWMTPMDDRILEVLNVGLVLSPAILAYNIEKSREAVSRRLADLSDAGLVNRIERARYEITDQGHNCLKGKWSREDLQT